MKLKNALISFGVGLGILCLVPILWSGRVHIDWAVFTTEWYKACVRIALVLIAFLIGSVIWERHKGERVEEKHSEALAKLAENWCTALRALNEEVDTTKVLLKEGSPELFRDILERMSSSSAVLGYIAASIEAEPPTKECSKLPEYANRFSKEVADNVAVLRASFSKGTLLPGRALDACDSLSLEAISGFCNDSLAKACS